MHVFLHGFYKIVKLSPFIWHSFTGMGGTNRSEFFINYEVRQGCLFSIGLKHGITKEEDIHY